VRVTASGDKQVQFRVAWAVSMWSAPVRLAAAGAWDALASQAARSMRIAQMLPQRMFSWSGRTAGRFSECTANGRAFLSCACSPLRGAHWRV
jgi:hypothetical protein